jgi:phage-related minor tail protein
MRKLSALQNYTVTTTISAKGSGASMTLNTGGLQGDQTDTTWKSTTSSLSGSITPKASGGRVVAGNLYQVGEIGPELFAPNQNGLIVPNSVLRDAVNVGMGAASSGGLHVDKIEVSIHNPSLRSDQDVEKLAEKVAQIMAEKMRQRLRYGGTLSY